MVTLLGVTLCTWGKSIEKEGTLENGGKEDQGLTWRPRAAFGKSSQVRFDSEFSDLLFSLFLRSMAKWFQI